MKKRRWKNKKSELLRAIERRLLLDHLEQSITAFRLYCVQRQNQRTAAELARRGVL